MWEILTGEEPYANMQFGAIIGQALNPETLQRATTNTREINTRKRENRGNEIEKIMFFKDKRSYRLWDF